MLRWGILLCLLLASAPRLALGDDVRVDIEGVSGELLTNVRALLSIVQGPWSEQPDEFRVRHYHRRAATEIRAALEPFGYYQVSVDSELHREESGWRAQYRIQLGEPLYLARVEIRILGEAEQDAELQKMLESLRLRLRSGEIAAHSQYEAAKKTLLQRALSLGYLDAHYLLHRLEVDVPGGTAGVRLHLDSGIAYQLGEVSFMGADLKPALLQAYVPFRPGDPYRATRLLELQRALEDSDYFADVEVQAHRKPDQDAPEQAAAEQRRRVPVQVQLTAKPPNKYTAGLGLGTDTGIRASIGWFNRRLNRSGHQGQLEYRISEIREGFVGRYRIPLAKPRTDFLELHSLFGREDTDTSESRIASLGVNLSTVRNRWRRALSLSYQQEDFDVGNTSGDTALLIPAVSYRRNWAGGRLVADQGAQAQIEFKGASESLLSDVGFVQARLNAKLIQSFGPSGRWIARGTAGATATQDFDNLPPSIRFFAGGDHSVRGYDYNSLGPTDGSGKVVGGSYLLVGSLEYEHTIHGKWGAAIFYDLGNAMDAIDEPLAQGAGVGLRWRSPIGMVRVDVAAALSENGHPLRLHLNVGPDL